MFLTSEEIEILTGKKRRKAQAQVLNHMHIKYLMRPDNSIVVLKDNLTPPKEKSRKSLEPNFSALHHAQ